MSTQNCNYKDRLGQFITVGDKVAVIYLFSLQIGIVQKFLENSRVVVRIEHTVGNPQICERFCSEVVVVTQQLAS